MREKTQVVDDPFKDDTHMRSLAFLTKVASELVEFPSKKDIYQFIGNQVKDLVGDAIVIVNSYDAKSGLLNVRAILGAEKYVSAMIRTLGREPIGMSFEIGAKEKHSLYSGRLMKVLGGLYELSFGKIPNYVCKLIEKTIELGDAYAMGLFRKGKLLGSVSIIMRGGAELKDPEVVETFINQASIALKHKMAEEDLKESEERLQAIFSSIPDGVTITGLNGTVLDCNNASLRLLGVTREEFVGKNFYDFISLEDRERAIREEFETLKRGYSRSEVKALRKCGDIFDAEIDVTVLRDPKGKPTAFLGVTRDITERREMEKALRESEKKYSTIVERGNDGILIIQDGLIKFANQMLVEMTGLDLNESIGKPFIDFVSPEFRKSVGENYEKRISGEKVPSRYEIEITSKSGKFIPVEISASLIEYRGKPADMAIIRDITERKKMEMELKDEINALERLQEVLIKRESRVISLKNELEELERELNRELAKARKRKIKKMKVSRK